MRTPAFLALLTALALASVLVALAIGSASISTAELWAALRGAGSETTRIVLFELRLPRAFIAFLTGALLALAGALLQVLLRNPLADPYVLGVSGGAAVAALVAMLLGVAGLALTGSAFAGGLIATLLVFGLARGPGAWSGTRLLLTGVVLAAGWGALIGFILSLSPDAGLRGMLFWLMGDLSYASDWRPALAVLVVGLLATWPTARSLNVMARGELLAGSLGVDVRRTNLRLFAVSALLTATAVTQAGSIGFVGLVVPHLVRLAGFTDHRVLLPAAALAGGTLVVFADSVARTLLAPQQLPVGVVTALLGVPLFLYLLQREAGRA
ncbi:MAG: iron ABC transporter permease [Pseudomonadota bacterium]|nr:MAG: iron ABC transporter permease [Pseudomonadota bacterium]